MATPTLTPDELLTTTRTVRKRLDLTKPVPIELVRECLEIALQAPSGSNRQGWEWVVVTDQDQRRAIGEIYGRAVEEYLGSRGSATKLFADDPERSQVQQRVGSSVAWLGEHMGDVPVLLLPCIHAGLAWPTGTRRVCGARCSRGCGATCSPLVPVVWARRGRRST